MHKNIANASPNARGPNATYIPPARVGLALGLRWARVGLDLCWALLTRVGHNRLTLGVHVGSARVFRYQHVGIDNAKVLRWGYVNPQHKWFRVTVEYRL